MRRLKQRNSNIQGLLHTNEKFTICPVCMERAKVGGPLHNTWTIQPHGSPHMLCEGTNHQLPVKGTTIFDRQL
jgi:hypothetical protein